MDSQLKSNPCLRSCMEEFSLTATTPSSLHWRSRHRWTTEEESFWETCSKLSTYRNSPCLKQSMWDRRTRSWLCSINSFLIWNLRLKTSGLNSSCSSKTSTISQRSIEKWNCWTFVNKKSSRMSEVLRWSKSLMPQQTLPTSRYSKSISKQVRSQSW